MENGKLQELQTNIARYEVSQLILYNQATRQKRLWQEI